MAKLLKYITRSLLIGLTVILAINFLGQFVNFNLPINLISITLIGFLHLPGFIVLLILLLL